MKENGNPGFTAYNCPNCGAAAKPDSVVCIYCGSPIATKICPSCFGSVAITMKHCPRCGSALADSNVSSAESPLHCPLCDVKLALASVGKHALHECIHCGGLWIDKNIFQDICSKEEAQEAVLHFRFEENHEQTNGQQKRKRAYIPCPECGKLMNHKNFSRGSGIILDWCRNHGSWFDRQELQQIIRFIRMGGLQKARERDRMQLKEENARLRMKQFELAARSNRMNSYGGVVPGFDRQGDSILDFIQETFFD
jgi:Zn-finger nucleic acid-binding protein